MISNTTLLQIKRKIIESKVRIMRDYPVFGLMLMHLKFVIDESVEKVSLNDKCIFFNLGFIKKLHATEMDFMFCHLLMHIVNHDIWRDKDFRGDNYHYGCDVVNNSCLRELKIGEDRYGHLGKIHWRFGMQGQKGHLFTPIEISSSLIINLERLEKRERAQFLFDSDEKWDNARDCGEGRVVVLDADGTYVLDKQEETISLLKDSDGLKTKKDNGAPIFTEMSDDSFLTEQNSKEKWEYIIALAIEHEEKSKSKQAGQTTLGQILKLNKLNKPKVDWKKILNEFLREEITDYSFTPPDKRFGDHDFFLPDYNERDFVETDVLFAVDSSGSIDVKDLTLAYSEIKGAIEQFAGKLVGKLIFFDFDVTKEISFSSVDDILREKPRGGGGTNFYSIFEYLARKYRATKPAYIIVFTDGYAPIPEKELALGVPVLWLINNEKVTPNWGKVVRIIN